MLIIERAIKKGIGGEGANLTEITFEGYASKGIVVFVEATTDNNNRTVASVDLPTNMEEIWGQMVLDFYLKEKDFYFKKESIDIEDLEELEMELIDYGLEELTTIDDEVIIQTTFDDYGKCRLS